jgi:glycosyltransferase involved in cell wall biosynthesis
MKKNPKVIIVMPAYNAERTVRDSYKEIPTHLRKNIILVDDGSTDNTVGAAKKLGIKVFEHSNNLGYGGNQKTCYWEALKLKPDIVVMLHPDYQYDARMIDELIAPIEKGRYDFMFGSRIANKKEALDGGMPKLKYYVNRIVCFIQNILLGVNFTEHFSGFRAFSVDLLKKVPFQRFSNDFVFDQEMTISSLSYGFRIGEISIPTRYHEKASSIQFVKGAKFVLEGFMVTVSLYLSKLGIVKDERFAVVKRKPRSTTNNLFLLLFVSLLNMLFLNLFFVHTFISLIILAETILLYWSWKKQYSISKALSLGGLAVISLASLIKAFEKYLFNPTNLEADTIFRRQEYLGQVLGKLYGNRFGVAYFSEIRPVIVKYIGRSFSNLDFAKLYNLDNLLSLVFVPFLLIGILVLIRKPSLLIMSYFLLAVLVGGFLNRDIYGILLLLPLVNFALYLGTMTFLRFEKI